MISIAIFASGSGSNAQKIMEYFQSHATIQVKLVLSNKTDAFVLNRAASFGVPTYTFNRQVFYESNTVLQKLQDEQIDYIVLAGFLWLVPLSLIQAYPNKIVNIHPALLPAYGGKGMYGMRVHEAIVANHEPATGITIHLVNEEYDKGKILFQTQCSVETMDTPDTVAEKIHILEHMHYPRIIQEWIEEAV